jgi:hypothetical protein
VAIRYFPEKVLDGYDYACFINSTDRQGVWICEERPRKGGEKVKTTNVLCKLLLAFFYVFLSSGFVQSAEFSKILIIMKDQPIASSLGTEQGLSVKIVNIEDQNAATTAEAILAKHLIGANYEVVTSDELAPFSWLKNEDILAAKKGNVTKTRKVAAFHDANIIFIGSIKTGINTEASIQRMC